MRGPGLAALVLLLSSSATGCSLLVKECTLIGCSDGLALEVSARGSPLPPGVYKFHFALDGAIQELECAVQVEPRASRCDSLGGARGGALGGAVYDAAGKTSKFQLRLAPAKTISMLLASSNGLRVERTFGPTYREFEPNGPGCAPTCVEASASIEVDP